MSLTVILTAKKDLVNNLSMITVGVEDEDANRFGMVALVTGVNQLG